MNMYRSGVAMIFQEAPLSGTLAFVTGSSRGIGRAIALELAEWGADVVVHALKNLEAAEQVALEVRERGRKSMAVLADVRDKAAMSACADRVQAELGQVEILVNNAGIRKDGHFILMGTPAWEEVMSTNLMGPVHATQAFVRGMMNARKGCIINMVSPAAIIGTAGQANYSASKAALIGLTHSLARELSPYGIRVNAVNPGLIETDLTASLPEKTKQELLAPTHLKRMGLPGEVSPMVTFLASPWASYISGQIINVDGGLCP